MAIHRETLQCLTCGQKTVTRTTIGGDDYQDCAFPCPKCGIEITYRLMLYLNTRMRELTATGLHWQEAMKSLKDIKITQTSPSMKTLAMAC